MARSARARELKPEQPELTLFCVNENKFSLQDWCLQCAYLSPKVFRLWHNFLEIQIHDLEDCNWCEASRGGDVTTSRDVILRRRIDSSCAITSKEWTWSIYFAYSMQGGVLIICSGCQSFQSFHPRTTFLFCIDRFKSRWKIMSRDCNRTAKDLRLSEFQVFVDAGLLVRLSRGHAQARELRHAALNDVVAVPKTIWDYTYTVSIHYADGFLWCICRC